MTHIYIYMSMMIMIIMLRSSYELLSLSFRCGLAKLPEESIKYLFKQVCS